MALRKTRATIVARPFGLPLLQLPGTPASGTPATLGERVYQALKKDIIYGVYQSGEALSEKDLVKRYKGSRTPVREAALRLEQENLLRIVPNRGYFVSPITIEWLNEVYEYRAAVESGSAELAAKKGSDDALLEQLIQLAHTEHHVGDRESYECFIQADTTLHIGIARLTRNQLLVRSVAEIRCQMERIMRVAMNIGYFGELPVREHCEILEAIRRRDQQAARSLMYGHIIGSRGKVLQIVTSQP